MKKFIREIFACVTLLKRLYLGCFTGKLDKILQRHCGMMIWKFRWVVFYLVDRSLRQFFEPQLFKLGNRDFVSKFVDRIEDSTVL